MGFCIFNNASIAARYVQHKHGAGKVLIVDWDVHHGNGTQDIFYADGSVFYFSTHQSPFYPGTGSAEETGTGAGRGTTLNVPLMQGSTGAEIVKAIRNRLHPAMKAFRPDFVIISAGFDARIGDTLGGLRATDHDFEEMTSLVMDIAKDYAGGRLVSLLEGGYDLSGLSSAVEHHVRTLVEHA